MNQTDNSPKGLPRHFIVIGICLILLPLVFMAITKLMYDDLSSKFGERNMEIIEAFSGTCIILGLLMITLTRSKVETEATKNARITGLVGGFMTGIVMILLTPLFDLFNWSSIENLGVRQFVIWMLVMSIIFRFTAQKTTEKQVKKQE